MKFKIRLKFPDCGYSNPKLKIQVQNLNNFNSSAVVKIKDIAIPTTGRLTVRHFIVSISSANANRKQAFGRM